MNPKHERVLAEFAKVMRRGAVVELRVLHDDWCPTLATGSGAACRCDPDLKVVVHRDGFRQ
jgi:hypothetical protein